MSVTETRPAVEQSLAHSVEHIISSGGMGVAEAVRVALEGLFANKLRSFLTMLGIIIGVSAVIVMVSLGQGVAKATQEQIEKLGTNVLTVRPDAQQQGGVNMGLGTMQTLKLSDAQTVLKSCPAVKAVSPEYSDRGTVKFHDQNTVTRIQGAGPDYFSIRNQPIAAGKAFTKDDVDRKAKVVVLGDNVREALFGNIQAVGKYIKLNGQSFLVVGVVAPRGDSGWRSPDDQVTIPITTAMVRVFGVDHLDSMSVQARSQDEMIQAQDELTQVLSRAHRLRPGDPPDIRVFNQADLTESAAQQTTFLTMLLAGIALVSLIVGGIGIMNIMLVSVTERTREIGIRKAIGARRKDILYQFLIESTTLSLVGGLIGVGLGIGVAVWMALPNQSGGLGFPTLISLPPIVVSFVFSAVVGIVFGVYPAIKASRLNPIEALRYE